MMESLTDQVYEAALAIIEEVHVHTCILKDLVNKILFLDHKV